jgi:hypothetical protein
MNILIYIRLGEMRYFKGFFDFLELYSLNLTNKIVKSRQIPLS